jgi:c-di-GMP-binding flagellar brake protein YcgR
MRMRDSLSVAMDKPKQERRNSERVPLSVPVAVRATDQAGELSATTRDLSSNGIFLYTQSKMQPGSQIELVLILPPELAGGERRWACCQASVVRVENGPDSGFGVAATLDNVDLLPEIEG